MAESARDTAQKALLDLQDTAPTPGYEVLAEVLNKALLQASVGKGRERHANDLPFGQQKMQVIAGLYHGPEGMLYQATKKATEANEILKRAHASGSSTDIEKAKTAFEVELLGAINYLAGAVIFGRSSAE